MFCPDDGDVSVYFAGGGDWCGRDATVRTEHVHAEQSVVLAAAIAAFWPPGPEPITSTS